MFQHSDLHRMEWVIFHIKQCGFFKSTANDISTFFFAQDHRFHSVQLTANLKQQNRSTSSHRQRLRPQRPHHSHLMLQIKEHKMLINSMRRHSNQQTFSALDPAVEQTQQKLVDQYALPLDE